MSLIEHLQIHISDFICREADLPEDEIDLHMPLGALGVGSLVGTRLIGNLEEHFGVRLCPTLVFEHPSISELAEAIAEIASQANREGLEHV
jgi:acyl carrier protein